MLRRAAAVLGLGLVSGYLVAPLPALELRLTSGRGERAALFPIQDGEGVVVGFQHSLYKVDQIETYRVVGGGLALDAVFLGSFDALNYYDPLGALPSRRQGDGYEVRFRAPEPREVTFAIAHQTPIWLRVGGLPSVMLSDTDAGVSGFSLRVSQVSRLRLFFAERRA
jgi:hypothetical protein